jgi:hypothetical protein
MRIHTHGIIHIPGSSGGDHTRPFIIMLRTALLTLALCPTLAVAMPARGAAESGPWLAALSSGFVVTDVATGDLDGDGSEETAVCFVEPRGAHGRGGIAVLSKRGGVERLMFQAMTNATCERIKIASGRIGVLTKGKEQLAWTYGKDLVFIDQRNHPLQGTKATASSTLSASGIAPEAALDGDLETSWAEGASGTGITQTLTLTLPRPTHVAYVAILGGSGMNKKAYYESNRIHRASIEVQTKDDLGDTDTGLDFADLGIDIGGDRVDFSLENRPEIRFIRVDKKDVMKLEVRVESVYLGSKNDDTHIAELIVIPELSSTKFVTDGNSVAQSPKPLAKGTLTPKPGKSENDDEEDEERAIPQDERSNRLVDDLDKGSRSIVEDEEF